jgi:glycosyltransferase involved in cell wall biosynthesis
MPKLLQINVVNNTGSVGRIMEEIGALAVSNGWESYIAWGRRSGPSKSTLIRIGSAFSVYLHGLKTRLFDRHGFGSRHATQKLIHRIQAIKPDIIHLHVMHGYYLNIRTLFNFLSEQRIPVVWTFHDCWAITGHCVHFEDIGCYKWQSRCYKCPALAAYPSSGFFDSSFRNYREKKQLFNSVENLTIVPVCAWLKDIVKASYLQNKNIQTIPNGIDTAIFKPVSSTRLREKLSLEGKFIILAAANVWNKTKGLYDIFELSEKLDKETIIVMAGLTGDKIKQLPSDIKGIGHTENVYELVELYSLSDVLVNPTYQDTLPTISIESLACGTPVITYNTGGCAEVVDDETGIVVERGDQAGLLNAVRLVQKMGKTHYTNACRKRAVAFFDKNSRYKEYLTLYEKLLIKDETPEK